MGMTIQFESHRVELPFVYGVEHDPQVLEYYDQPPLYSTRLSRGKRKTLVRHAYSRLFCASPRFSRMGGMQNPGRSREASHQESTPLLSR